MSDIEREPEKPPIKLRARPKISRKERFHEFKFDVKTDTLRNIVDLEDAEREGQIVPRSQAVMLLVVVHPETDDLMEFEFSDIGLWNLIRELSRGFSTTAREQLGRELLGEISFPTLGDNAA